jgi:hypothetical protein
MAAFGYGNKSDFTKGENFPAPNQYKYETFIDRSKKKNRGKSFGVSRSVVTKNNADFLEHGLQRMGWGQVQDAWTWIVRNQEESRHQKAQVHDAKEDDQHL